MTSTMPFERKAPPSLDTAVRSLSTLRKPVRNSDERDDRAEPRTLLGDIQLAVRAGDCGLGRVASPNANLAFQPRFLLSLLVYCYVSGTFGSAEIEEMMRTDATFRDLCRDEVPTARTLRRFRRENRPAIRDCIFTVLCRQSERSSPPGEVGNSRWSEALMEEADGRILKAMFIDQMDNDI